MLVHIVMWKFKEQNKDENINSFREMLLELPSIIEEIKYMEVGKDTGEFEGNYDLVLVSKFNNSEDLGKYKKHPAHVKVSKFCASVREDRACVDYEV